MIPIERVDEFFTIHDTILSGELREMETIRQRKDGTLFDVHITFFPIHNRNGKIIAFSGITKDITARKQTEKLVEESRQRYKSLIEHNPDIANPLY